MPFSDIIGQERAAGVFRAYLRNGRLAGGYLLTGPDGVGKKALAVRVAQALFCRERESDSCGTCGTCSRVAGGTHPDVHAIEPEDSDIKIEEIRHLQRVISLRSYEGGPKAFIIDNAHRLNAESANCLLKVLEEPPAESVLFLITSKPALLPRTVVSRCKPVACPGLPRQRLEELLRERQGITPEEAHFLAYYSEGSLGASLRLHGLYGLKEKNALIDRFLRGSVEPGAAVARDELRAGLSFVASWIRDILLLKIGVPGGELVNADRCAELRAGGESFSFARLYEIIKVVSNSLLYLEQNVNTRLILSHVHSELSVR